MQSKEELENWYSTPDPWGYTQNPEDTKRKEIILSYLTEHKKALDIGAGEGWITKDIPAQIIHALEISDKASSRFPTNVTRVTTPDTDYDLIVACGVLYQQYDWQRMIDILKTSKKTILTCNISDWELGLEQLGKPDVEIYFPYRNYQEHLCVYNVVTT